MNIIGFFIFCFSGFAYPAAAAHAGAGQKTQVPLYNPASEIIAKGTIQEVRHYNAGARGRHPFDCENGPGNIRCPCKAGPIL
jgi:hypothetical protein